MTLAAIRDLPIGTRFRYGDATWARVEGETFNGHGCLAQHVGDDGTPTTWDDDGTPVLGAFFAGEVVEIIEQQEAA